MKIGAQLFTVRNYCQDLSSFAETLRKIADIGYTTVQVSGTCAFEAQWLKAQLDKNGLRCVITHTAPQKLQEQLGMAVILVTHDLGVIADMCDNIVVMYGGRICERGTAADIFYDPRHEYTKGLLRSIPTFDEAKKRLVPIAGTPINMLNLPKGCSFCARCDSCMKICLTEQPEEIAISETHKASCWMNVKKMMEEEGGAANE